MASRAVPTWILVLLAMAAGALGGVYVEHAWRNWDWRVEWRRRERAAELAARDSARRAANPEQWRRDSLESAAWRIRDLPREVARRQAGPHCVVAFVFSDTSFRAPIFSVEARDRHFDGRVAASGIVYKSDGFGPGDTAHVVLREVFCGSIWISGWGADLGPPPPPLGLHVR